MDLKQLKQAVKTNGGATLTSDLDNAAIDSGYMVSLAGHEFKTNIDLLTIELLKDYQRIAEQYNAYVGLWLDGDDLYLDISTNIQDQQQAIKMARDNNQLAIYDIDGGVSVYV